MKTVVVVELDSREVQDAIVEVARKVAGENAGGAKVEFLFEDGSVGGAKIEFSNPHKR
jgi:hypothetical protein